MPSAVDDDGDPYQVLEISKTATSVEIKKAYKRLALQHHPDKQSTPQEKERATHKFATIAHAYEILSDPQRRQEYDLQQATPSRQHPFEDDQFFHDPFQIFEQVFGASFGGSSRGLRQSMFQNEQDMFFGLSPFGAFGGGAGSLFGGPSLFDHSPSLFGGGNSSSLFAGPSAAGGMSFVSTSMSGGNGNGSGNGVVSKSTTTRIVNGHRVTETVLQTADGRVERQRFEDHPPAAAAALPSSSKPHAVEILEDDDGEEDDDDDEEVPTDYDVCIGKANHPGTKEYLKALEEAATKYSSETAWHEAYSYIRERLKGRLFFQNTDKTKWTLVPSSELAQVIQKDFGALSSTKPSAANKTSSPLRRFRLPKSGEKRKR